MADGRKECFDKFDDDEEAEDDDYGWCEIQEFNENSLTIIPPTKYQQGDRLTSEMLQTSDLMTEANSAKDHSSAGPSRMSLNDHKAGMKGLDKEKINKIIYEASKGSKFYENEMLKEQQVKERIQRQTQRLDFCTEKDIEAATLQADQIVQDLEKTRDLSRTIVHLDMDAFYAAVEMRDDPSLRDKPMAVGSPGMLSTSNYVARRYGVRAAMPGFIGKKLCPELIIVPAHFDKYREASSIIRGILKDYDANFLPMSLDEAYLDLTDYMKEREKQANDITSYEKNTGNPVENERKEFGNDIQEIVKEIRYRIEQETKLTASAGIACNSMLAKICSDMNKPNGQFYLPSDREAVMKFIHDLPIRKISGIGRVSEQMLKALGIATCRDLYNKRHILVLLNSSISSHFLISISLGLGSTRLESSRERKSLSSERTFKELSKPDELFSQCQNLCSIVAEECRDENLKPKTVSLKLKTVNFQVKSRSISLNYPVTSAVDIFEAAKDLLSKEIANCAPKPLRLRLMGVRLSNFENSEIKEVKQDRITSFLRKSTQDEQSDKTDQKTQKTLDKNDCNETCFEAVCPVCSQLQIINNNNYLLEFNKHVDLCLNSFAIKEALEEQRETQDSKRKSVKRKQTHTNKNASQAKKATLEHFWSK